MKKLAADIRTLLVLGRISNLPTVWSNLLAGSILMGGFNPAVLVLLLLGGSCLYVGGMYLNDFCDAAFDAQYCRERPIPSGKIPRKVVGVLAVAWFVAGLSCFLSFRWITLEIALLLLAAIVLYDFHHKKVWWAPLLMGFCRFLLYPLAASANVPCSLPGYFVFAAVPAGIALGLYVTGITYLAKGESRPEKPTRWALILLLSPIGLSLGLGVGFYGEFNPEFFYCLLLLGWMAWLLVPLWRKTNRSIGRVVSGLLAGIVLVDMIAVASVLSFQPAWLLPLFVLALLLQRIIPAT